jgi:hypothetical protein
MEVHDQVVARRFVLVDEEDNPTAYITGAEGGFVGLHVQGPQGKTPLVSVGVEAETGLPMLRLRRAEGGYVLVSVAENGRATVFLVDADGSELIVAT